MEWIKKSSLRAKSAGQDAPPTVNAKDVIKTSYALIFQRNGIRRITGMRKRWAGDLYRTRYSLV